MNRNLQMKEMRNMYLKNEKEETEKIIKKAEKLFFAHQIVLTLICLGPIAWLLSGFEPERTQLQALLSIPTLIFIGYIWTNHVREKEMMELNREIDELYEEIDELNNEINTLK